MTRSIIRGRRRRNQLSPLHSWRQQRFQAGRQHHGLPFFLVAILILCGCGVHGQQDVRGIPFPYQRYVFYADLTAEERGFATAMGYRTNGRTWNLPGSNAIEELSFETISLDEPVAFAGLTGFQFGEEQWDCFIVRTPSTRFCGDSEHL